LPYVLESKQRLRFEAFVVSADTITHAFRTMWFIATHVGQALDQLDSPRRTAMISSAWQIVDHLHMIRQVLGDLIPAGPDSKTDEFLKLSEPATLLRNDMNHLNQKIGNLVARKDPFHPLFGSLAYVAFPKQKSQPGERPPPDQLYTVIITAGTLGRGEHMEIINPAGRKMVGPVDLFQLQAFDQTVKLSEVLSELSALAKFLEQELEKQMVKRAEEVSVATGKTVAELLAHPAAGIVMALPMLIKTKDQKEE
jgi:hypothetical protein